LISNRVLGARGAGGKVLGAAGRERGFSNVARRCRPPLAFALAAGALVVAHAFAMSSAAAQSPEATDRFLMRPVLDGDPRNPPRFSRPGTLMADPAESRIGAVPNYDYQPGLGTGRSGFNSSNPRRQKGKAAPKAKAAVKPGATTTAPAVASAAAPPPIMVGPPTAAVTRAPQYLERRGGPNYTGTGPGTALDADGPLRTGLALPAAPIRRLVPDATPFDPVGITWGAFTARPAVEVDGGHDSNASRTPIKRPSWFETVSPDLLVNSNWQRHSLTATLRGSYTTYNEAHDLDRPSFDGRLNGRVDVSSDTRLDLETRFLIATDNAGSPNVQAGVVKQPINTTLGGTFGFDQRFNRLDIALKGIVDRTEYQESKLSDGTTSSNEDRNFNRYASELRLNYELSPAVKPFVEFGVDTRVHDLLVDRNGLMRDSDGFFARAGSTFEFTRVLTGDVAGGWLTRTYKDPTLPNLSGPTIDGTLTWLASALTTFKFIAKTTAGETTLGGTAGVFTHEATFQIDHAFRQWLIATARFTYDNDNYVGSARIDNRYTAAATILYKLNREMQLKGEYRREWMHSSIAGVDYLSNVWLIGLRLQK
jgi:hypothetical protein